MPVPDPAARHPHGHPHVAPIALSVSAHDRAAGRRTDDAWLAEVWAAESTRVLPLHHGRLLLTPDADRPVWLPPADVPAGQRVLLGDRDGAVRFAVLAEEVPEGWRAEHLRALVTELGEDDAALVVHAVALAEWHRAHRHCPRCGGRLTPAAAGHLLHCDGCGRDQFPRTDPAVIMLVVDGADRCLLGRQPSWPEGRFSTLAGFVEPGESLEDAVRREVEEEVGVRVDEVTYFGNQPWPFPASLMVGFFARARTTAVDVDGEEISEARWFTRAELLAEAQAGTLLLPGRVSISRSLIETWYGGRLPGHW